MKKKIAICSSLGIYPEIQSLLSMEVKEVKELNKILSAEYGLPKVNLKNIGKEVKVRTTPKIGRNEPCPCHSGKKYKNCCI